MILALLFKLKGEIILIYYLDFECLELESEDGGGLKGGLGGLEGLEGLKGELGGGGLKRRELG